MDLFLQDFTAASRAVKILSNNKQGSAVDYTRFVVYYTVYFLHRGEPLVDYSEKLLSVSAIRSGANDVGVCVILLVHVARGSVRIYRLWKSSNI